MDERTRVSKNLYGELKDTLNTLEWRRNEDKDPGMEVKIDGQRYTFTNQFLNRDVYDSLIRSGKINFLKYELQQQVQNIFTMIKRHNEYVQVTGYNISQPDELKKFAPHYKMMERYEEDLLEHIPDVLEKLEKEFPRITRKPNRV